MMPNVPAECLQQPTVSIWLAHPASFIISLSIVSVGNTTIQVWDLYSGLELQIFRPEFSLSSAGDYHITALAAGTVHGHQVCPLRLRVLLYLSHLACLLASA